MKIYALILAASLLGLAISGSHYWRLETAVKPGGRIAEQVDQAKKRFLSEAAPTQVIRVAAIAGGGRDQLLDPATALPTTFRYPAKAIRALHAYGKTCDKPPAAAQPWPSELEKARLWHAYLCGHVEALPEDFFKTPPFMHPSGHSFAFLARRSGRREFGGDAWMRGNQGNFHVLELGGLPADGMTPAQRTLMQLSKRGLAAVKDQEPIVVSPSEALIHVPAGGNVEGGGEYRVFSRSQWQAATDDLPYVFTERRADTLCVHGSGHACWILRADDSRDRTFYAALAGGSVLTLALTLTFLIAQRLRIRRRDKEDQLFAVRTLAHELRTPATSLNLALTPFRREFDALSTDCQNAFLRLCDDVQRLNRTIAGSSRYLRSEGARAKDRLESKLVESVNEFVSQTLTAYAGRIEITSLETDRSLRTDPFWLGTCLTNLVENALAHGAPPVAVRLGAADGVLTFAVVDAGKVARHELKSMTKAFVKSRKSRGLGLGLAIVSKTVRDLGGTLELADGATTAFVITLKDQSS
jgi:signal transduction histidine kinase